MSIDINNVVVEFIKWNESVTRKLANASLFNVLLASFSFCFAQLLLVVAFFLPFKIIVLLASDNIPWYMTDFMSAENKDDVIAILVVLAIVLFALSSLFEWLYKQQCAKGSKKILIRASKINLFANQNVVATDLYQRLIRLFSSLSLILICFCIGAAVNVEVFLCLMALLIVEYFFLRGYVLRVSRTNEVRFASLKENSPILSAFVFNLSFLLIIAILFLLATTYQPIDVFVGILCIVLSRQILQRMQTVTNDVYFLNQNKARLNAIFYTGKQFDFALSSQQSFVKSINLDKVREIIGTFTSEFMVERLPLPDELSINWRDSGTADICAFDVTSEDKTFIPLTLKIYAQQKRIAFEHERLFFLEMNKQTGCLPHYLGSLETDTLDVSVYEKLPDKNIDRDTWGNTIYKLFIMLWNTEPSSELLGKYMRTTPLFYDKLSRKSIEQLHIATSDNEKTELSYLLHNYDAFREYLKRIPLFIANPEMSFMTVFHGNGRLQVSSWSRWTVEPVGAGLPVPLEEKAIEIAKGAIGYGGQCSSITVEDMLFGAYVYEIEKLLSRQLFNETKLFLPRMMELYRGFDKVN